MVLPTAEDMILRLKGAMPATTPIFSYFELIVILKRANELFQKGQPFINNGIYDMLMNQLQATRASTKALSKMYTMKLIELQDYKEYADQEYKRGKALFGNPDYDSLVFEITRRTKSIESSLFASGINSFVCANWSDLFLQDVLYELESQYSKGNSKVANVTYDIIAKEFSLRQSIHFNSLTTISISSKVILPPVVFPFHWSTPISGVDIIDLDRQSSEFQALESGLKSSLPMSVVFSIKRVQNYGLYRMYYYTKLLMGKSYGRQSHAEVEERTLFHGCSQQAGVDAIIKDGFYRQYCPNGAIGDGCYYALQASYSNNNPYVLNFPDKTKQLFIVKVLVGKSTRGNMGLKTVPAGFESVNDGPYHMYCIFNHYQAYPEYTIHYRS